MTPEFLKQKSQWLHSSIKFPNPDYFTVLYFFERRFSDEPQAKLPKILDLKFKTYKLLLVISTEDDDYTFLKLLLF